MIMTCCKCSDLAKACEPVKKIGGTFCACGSMVSTSATLPFASSSSKPCYLAGKAVQCQVHDWAILLPAHPVVARMHG